MAASNRNQIIDEIKSRCNIVDVIGSVVALKKTGANYQGLCPFHNEKTPSFVVSETKQMFTCFGCHTSGDVIEFVKKYYNLTFMEALEKLASMCGLNIEGAFNKAEKKDIYYEVNTQAARFFFKALRSGDNPGLRYVKKRGLTKETLHDFGIGYADESWNSLYNFLKEKGYDEKIMLQLGLISESKGRYYDRFRNRVVFPIQNTAGKVIGFGARAIGDEMPKYLNSPETPVFSKKNNLYGLNITKNYVNKDDCAILVEGYMDVISLYQGGVKNVSASLGTALTENQARLLKRYTKNIVLSYDADSAGVNAAIRGSEILHREGCKVKILHITDGKDPDDFIKAKGKAAYYKLVESAVAFGDYRVEAIRRKYDIETTEGRVDFLKETAKFLKSLGPVEADIYIEKVSEKYRISAGALRTEMGLKQEETPIYENQNREKEKAEAVVTQISKIEQNIIKVLLTDSKYFKEVAAYDDIFTSIAGSNIFKIIERIYEENEEIDIEQLIENLDEEEVKVLKDIDENISLAGKTESIFRDCIRSHVEEKRANREKEIIMQLSIADEQENYEEIKRLTEELMNLQKEKSLGGK
ncbi:MAG: DNA primase [Eubacterium sp.]|nr:DNA primase [Eubacterium sp.]